MKERENIEGEVVEDFEFLCQETLIKSTYVKSYQLDSDAVRQRISESLAKFKESENAHFDLKVDIKKGLILMKIINKINGDVIKNIFPRTILYTSENLRVMIGILIDKKA
jgi:uncharacterized FlaG/YvyC family protein